MSDLPASISFSRPSQLTQPTQDTSSDAWTLVLPPTAPSTPPLPLPASAPPALPALPLHSPTNFGEWGTEFAFQNDAVKSGGDVPAEMEGVEEAAGAGSGSAVRRPEEVVD